MTCVVGLRHNSMSSGLVQWTQFLPIQSKQCMLGFFFFSHTTSEDWINVKTTDKICLTYIIIGLFEEKAHVIGWIIIRDKFVCTKLSPHCIRWENPQTQLSIPEQNQPQNQNPRSIPEQNQPQNNLVFGGLQHAYNIFFWPYWWTLYFLNSLGSNMELSGPT